MHYDALRACTDNVYRLNQPHERCATRLRNSLARERFRKVLPHIEPTPRTSRPRSSPVNWLAQSAFHPAPTLVHPCGRRAATWVNAHVAPTPPPCHPLDRPRLRPFPTTSERPVREDPSRSAHERAPPPSGTPPLLRRAGRGRGPRWTAGPLRARRRPSRRWALLPARVPTVPPLELLAGLGAVLPCCPRAPSTSSSPSSSSGGRPSGAPRRRAREATPPARRGSRRGPSPRTRRPASTARETRSSSPPRRRRQSPARSPPPSRSPWTGPSRAGSPTPRTSRAASQPPSREGRASGTRWKATAGASFRSQVRGRAEPD